jgi:hypothetical protein
MPRLLIFLSKEPPVVFWNAQAMQAGIVNRYPVLVKIKGQSLGKFMGTIAELSPAGDQVDIFAEQEFAIALLAGNFMQDARVWK